MSETEQWMVALALAAASLVGACYVMAAYEWVAARVHRRRMTLTPKNRLHPEGRPQGASRRAPFPRLRRVLLAFQLLACLTLIGEMWRGFYDEAVFTALAWGVLRIADDFLGKIIAVRGSPGLGPR